MSARYFLFFIVVWEHWSGLCSARQYSAMAPSRL